MDMSTIKPDVLVYLKHKALPIKKILGVLKDMLTDVNIEFGNCCVIEGLDPEKVTATRLHLLHVEEYVCMESDIRVGVYLSYLHKMLRGVTPQHELEMTIKRDTPSVLEIIVTNPDKNTRSFTAVKSIEIPRESISIPTAEYESGVTVMTKDLQRAIREVALLSKKVCFGYSGDNLTLIASGNLGVANISIGPTPTGMIWHKRTRDSSHAFYFTKFLEKIIRPDISDTIDIYFTHDKPMVLQYSDRDYLGVFEFAVAEIPEPK